MDVVGRLAPSPTGVLHVGNARSLLWAWLSARSAGGSVLLRIEDLLPGSPEHVGSLLDDLCWLGLDWDDPGRAPGRVTSAAFAPHHAAMPAFVLQSERAEVYRSAIEALAAANLVYACVCTRADIDAALRAPHAEDVGARYPGTCLGRFADLATALRWEAAKATRLGRVAIGAAQRMRAPMAAIGFDDRLRGPQLAKVARSSGDFVVRRKDGTAAYMLAVVVDDLAMGVTEIVRGDDLLDVTGQQIVVYRGLLEHALSPAQRKTGLNGDAALPRWTHVPLVYGDDGRRLAKRNRSLHVQTMIAQGVRAADLRAWLAASMGLPAIGDLAELARAYRDVAAAGALCKEAVFFDEPELAALSAGEVPPVRIRCAPKG